MKVFADNVIADSPFLVQPEQGLEIARNIVSIKREEVGNFQPSDYTYVSFQMREESRLSSILDLFWGVTNIIRCQIASS